MRPRDLLLMDNTVQVRRILLMMIMEM